MVVLTDGSLPETRHALSTDPALERSPYENLPRRTVILIMAGVLLAVLLAALDLTVVGTAMPRVVADLGGFEQYAWVITAYMVASTVTMPLAGKLSDLHGRKPYYLAAIVVFLVGSALCGASQSMLWLVLSRALQGLGAGAMQAMAFSVIGDLFPPAERGRVQGLTASVFGMSAIFGPALGGYITDFLSWRWVFYVNLPIGLLALAALATLFPNLHVRRPHGGIDVVGAVLLVLCVVPLLLALSWGGTAYAWDSPFILGLLGLVVLAGASFLLVERRAAEPMLPPWLFSHRLVGNAWFVAFLTSVGMFGTVLILPIYMQGVLGTSATVSGSTLAPLMLSFVVASTLTGQLITRTARYKPFAVLGQAIVVVAFILLSLMGRDADPLTVVRNLAVMGIGLGIGMPTFTIAIQSVVPYSFLGAATASTQFMRSIGGTLGTALTGTLIANRFVANLRAGLPPELGAQLPAAVLNQVQDPQALFVEGGVAELGSSLAQSPVGPDRVPLLTEALRYALASAIQETFLIGIILLAVSFVATWLLPEVKLRRKT